MSKFMIKKNVCLNDHSVKRLKQRYVLKPSSYLTNAILQKAKKYKMPKCKKAEFIKNGKKGRIVLLIRCNKKSYKVVLDKELTHIITFLPVD